MNVDVANFSKLPVGRYGTARSDGRYGSQRPTAVATAIGE
jgi:hypothetical protein